MSAWYLVNFDYDIGLVLDLRNWPVFNDDLARPLEDYCLHGIFAHSVLFSVSDSWIDSTM
jgi:hypothetical protein